MSDGSFDTTLVSKAKHELWIVPLFFAAIGVFTIIDIVSDIDEEFVLSHVMLELSIATVSFAGLIYFLKKNIFIKKELVKEKFKSAEALKEAQLWKEKNQKQISSFSNAIDEQLTAWKLTPAEKDVALFLLKGFSTAEIANFRKSAEKTIKQQCSSIYAKSALSGRAELAAFFLEDLLSQH